MKILAISPDWEKFETALANHGLVVEYAPEAFLDSEESKVQRSLLILDEWSQPSGGFELLRRLRQEHATDLPVLMLVDSDTSDARAAGFEAGADDCIGRHISGRELVARVRSLLLRSNGHHDAGEDGNNRRLQLLKPRHIEANGVRLDRASREVACDGRSIETTTVEFDILTVLMQSAGQPVSRDELMERLYHRKATAFDRSIDMHVSHLRRKFLGAGRTLIKTVRGAGYQFCLPGEETMASDVSDRLGA
jgi:two-component system, OmpR family, response regulator CpxR